MKFDRSTTARWIESEDVDSLVAFLMSGTHHGKPGAPAAVKLRVVGLIRELCAEALQVAWTDRLMNREEHVARAIACGLAASGWKLDRKATVRRMKALAEDPDWEVREWAADLFGGILALDLKRVLPLYRSWAEEGSEALRRAIALGLANRAKARVASEAAPMLAIMEVLMAMPGSYLQKNLGPFALGGGFLGRFPDQTLALCRRLSRRRNEDVRWNVAMALTSAAARKHRKAGEEILDRLAADERPRIARAVARARRNLAKGRR